MNNFPVFGKRYIHGIRFCSLYLALVFCLGAINLPVYAANNPAVPINPDAAVLTNSETDEQAQQNTETSSAIADSEPAVENIVPVMDITSSAALIVSTGRGMVLYHNSEDISANYPAASKLMTAVIALESLTLDTQVTISSDAEALDKDAKVPLHLSKGEKCSVKFLVTALLYMDSDAAAFSLAEYISSDEMSFVKRMNETAKALNMSNTLYSNTSGMDDITSYPTSVNNTDYVTYARQYTTVTDLSLLFRYALNNQVFKELFSKYKTLMFFSDGTPQTLTNTMSAAWGLNPQLKGAARFECSDSSSSSCILALASVDDFEIAIILGGSQDDSIYQDLYKSINGTYSAYEVSDLVVAGDTYTMVTIPGISEPLTAVFAKTVRYIHPVGKDYIKPDAVFIPDEAVTLPVSIGQSLGHVRFELEDGTQIDTEVAAAESMWTKSDFLSDTMALLVANSNLSVIILIAVAFFLVSVIVFLRRLFRKIIRTRGRSRKSIGR